MLTSADFSITSDYVIIQEEEGVFRALGWKTKHTKVTKNSTIGPMTSSLVLEKCKIF
jgi:hypothetical protein